MDKIIPISDLQTKAKQYVDQVKETDQPVVITQRGRAAAVLVSYESYESHSYTQYQEPEYEEHGKEEQGKYEEHEKDQEYGKSEEYERSHESTLAVMP